MKTLCLHSLLFFVRLSSIIYVDGTFCTSKNIHIEIKFKMCINLSIHWTTFVYYHLIHQFNFIQKMHLITYLSGETNENIVHDIFSDELAFCFIYLLQIYWKFIFILSHRKYFFTRILLKCRFLSNKCHLNSHY